MRFVKVPVSQASPSHPHASPGAPQEPRRSSSRGTPDRSAPNDQDSHPESPATAPSRVDVSDPSDLKSATCSLGIGFTFLSMINASCQPRPPSSAHTPLINCRRSLLARESRHNAHPLPSDPTTTRQRENFCASGAARPPELIRSPAHSQNRRSRSAWTRADDPP